MPPLLPDQSRMIWQLSWQKGALFLVMVFLWSSSWLRCGSCTVAASKTPTLITPSQDLWSKVTAAVPQLTLQTDTCDSGYSVEPFPAFIWFSLLPACASLRIINLLVTEKLDFQSAWDHRERAQHFCHIQLLLLHLQIFQEFEDICAVSNRCLSQNCF